MASGTYHEPTYQTDIDNNQIRYGRSYTDFDKTLNYFNLSRLPDYSNMAEPYIAYILMSRPSLNLAEVGTTVSDDDDNAYNNLSNFKQNAMTSAFTNDRYGKQLLMSLSEWGNNVWLPIITTKAMNYSVNDIELKTIDKGNTYYGHVIKYGKHSEDHKVSGTLSIDFRNDRYLSILKMMYMWMCYIYQVSKNGSIQPRLLYQRNAILDYTASIYYLITRRDGRELVYWDKTVGVFPTRVPMSIFSSQDSLILEDKVTIEFAYGIKSDPCDPSILMDINYLSGDSYNQIVTKSSYGNSLSNQKYLNNHEVPFVMGDVFASNPYIQMKMTDEGALKYYLQWEG